MSKANAKGTAAETAVARYLQDNDFPLVERRRLSGAHDRGDLAGLPGIVIEVKNQKTMKLAQWVDEAEQERINDGADIGVVWHKRLGRGSPSDWYVTMTGAQWLHILQHLLRQRVTQ